MRATCFQVWFRRRMTTWSSGQHDHAAGGLIDQGLVVGLERAHHHAADHVVGVRDRRSAGRGDALRERHADRHAERNRFGDRAGDGEEFFRYRPAGRGGHVHGRLDVHHHGIHGQRDPARRNDAAQRVVDQDELVARRVGVAQGADFHASRQLGAEQVDHVLVFFLDADDGPTGPDQLHGDGHAFDGGVEVIAEDFFVFMEQRFAFGRIQQDRIGLPGELDVGRESGPARADHARFGDRIQSHLCHGNSWDVFRGFGAADTCRR